MAFISTLTAGDPVTFRYVPVAQDQVSGISADWRGANNYRPNVTGDPYGDRTTSNYFTRSAFEIPPTSAPFGNAGRNTVRGPRFWQVDFALQKGFRLPIGSATHLQVRAEAFNLFNRANFHGPGRQRERQQLRDDHEHVRTTSGAVGRTIGVVSKADGGPASACRLGA